EGLIVEESLLNEYQSQINQILKVSFDHLSPASVKKCFAYCSIFPQDTELGEDELIQHWVAEGFVLPDQKNNRVMEETGGKYLRILLQNSLLEKVEDEGSTYYKMHDLGGVSTDMLLRFKHLHVLRLSGDDVKFLPSSIGKLLSLRLLDISSSGIRSLPESLCKLYNLQTLTMSNGGFPKRMSDLISLRHLNYYHDDAEFKMPAQMGLLTCLQTLEFFNVSQERGHGIEELGTLKYLKGSLHIRNLGLVKGKEAAKQAKLFEKPDLSRLVFEWESGDRKSDNRDEDVLEGLQPPPNLQRLEIHSFMGNKFPQWLINLSKLEELEIEDCKRCSELPSLGQLPSLKRLSLMCLDNIRFIGDEFYGQIWGIWLSGRMQTVGEAEADVFPLLSYFRIQSCPQLTALPDLDLFGSSLQRLTIDRCPRLISLGETPSLEEFTLVDCPKLLPHSFKGFAFATSLRELSINRIRVLPDWSGNLVSLETLELSNCDKLQSLPPEAAMRRLTKLNHVEVYWCPLLRQRYTPQRGIYLEE
ncbi:unnamed protein product, partial [Coffea canephora]